MDTRMWRKSIFFAKERERNIVVGQSLLYLCCSPREAGDGLLDLDVLRIRATEGACGNKSATCWSFVLPHLQRLLVLDEEIHNR